MLEDLLTRLSKIDSGPIRVVASDDSILDRARHFGCIAVREQQMTGINAAVTKGFSLAAEGASVAMLPGDVPLVSETEIEALIAPPANDKPTIRLSPAYDYKSTNGLFLSSGNLLKPAFGNDSFYRYLASARRTNLEAVVLDAPLMAQHIDTPDNLIKLMSHNPGGATGAFLRRIALLGSLCGSGRGAA